MDLKQNKSFKEIEKPLKEHFEAREDVARDFITPSLYYKSGLMDSAPWIATLALSPVSLSAATDTIGNIYMT